MITYSAPGKVCLFGEHGVVYGKHSIACSINLRTYVSIEELPYSKYTYIEKNNYKYDINKNKYILELWKEMGKIIDLKNFSIKINSQIPICSGLGSSSALIIALISCLNKYYNSNLNLSEIAEIGHKIEKNVQGLASPMDTYISSFGGLIKFPEKINIPSFDWDIIICNSMNKSNTLDLVKKVKLLKDKYPNIINSIFNSMDTIVLEAEKSILKKDIYRFSEMMNFNQGLLDIIGVGSKKLSRLIYNIKNYGALGSKITGSGGGGCILSVSKKKYSNNIINNMNKNNFKTFLCQPTDIGVRNES